MFLTSFLFWTVFAGQNAAGQALASPPAQLLAWQAAAQAERVECEFTRYVYDHSFSTTKIGTGRIIVDRKLGTRFELKPSSRIPSRLRKDISGVDYKVVPETASIWVVTDEWVLDCQPEDKTAWRMSRSPRKINDSDGLRRVAQFVVDWFQFGRRAVAALRGGVLADDELISIFSNATGSQVTAKDNLTIISTNATGHRAEHYSRVRVAFIKGNDFPDSIAFIAPSQKSETVYVFRNIQTGPSNSELNPAEIDLSDYEVREVN